MSVDHSDSNKLVTQRPVASLTDARDLTGFRVAPLQVSAYLLMRNISGYGKAFRSETEISSARGLGGS